MPQEAPPYPLSIEVQFFKRRDIKRAMFSTNLWSPITLGPIIVHVIVQAKGWNGQEAVRLFRTSCQGRGASAEYEEKQRGQE